MLIFSIFICWLNVTPHRREARRGLRVRVGVRSLYLGNRRVPAHTETNVSMGIQDIFPASLCLEFYRFLPHVILVRSATHLTGSKRIVNAYTM